VQGLLEKLFAFFTQQDVISPEWPKNDLKPSYDVLVIGGGLAGLTAAHALSTTHPAGRVALIERGMIDPAEGYDLLSPRRANIAHAPLHKLSQAYRASLTAMQKRTIGLRRCGMLQFLADETDLFHARNHIDSLSQGWIITPQEISKHARAITIPSALEGALWQPDAFRAERRKMALTHANDAARAGVDIVENCAALSIVADGGRVSGVQTTRGLIGARHVIVAGGAAPLLAPFGGFVALRAHRVTEIITQPVRGTPSPAILSRAHNIEMLGLDQGHYVIRSLSHETSPEALAARALSLLPGLSRLGVIQSRTFTHCTSADGLPLAGPFTSVDGLYVNTAWGNDLSSFAAGAAQALAASIARNRVHPALLPVLPERNTA
jgi:glycine/D-amino acid oxidase-like deaminating enzyme